MCLQMTLQLIRHALRKAGSVAFLTIEVVCRHTKCNSELATEVVFSEYYLGTSRDCKRSKMIQQTSMSSADGRNACEYHCDCDAEKVRTEGAEDGGKHI